jgi:hypothetical protein
MAKEMSSQIIIRATSEKIWMVLTDFPNYPNWNPFIRSIEGNTSSGNVIKARIEPPGAKGMTFKPRVISFDQNKKFSWLGHLLFPGLFDGEHIFEIIENGDGTCTFIQREKFKGLLVPLFSKMLDVNTKQGFEQMNQKLKERVEKIREKD